MNSPKIKTLESDIKKLKQKITNIKTELSSCYDAWDSESRKTGDSHIVFLEKEWNICLNKIAEKRRELRILKGEEEKVPAWMKERSEQGLECFMEA